MQTGHEKDPVCLVVCYVSALILLFLSKSDPRDIIYTHPSSPPSPLHP